ncbi:hypothetical protein D6C97_02761 [Aureobasidium pullulans]|nr:hypothetical protein D6C97_02761 [Aureobasidium pullulans]
MKPLYRLLGVSISLLAVTYYLYHIRLSHPLLEEPINHEDDQASNAQKGISEPSIGTVVASQTRDNTTWLPSLFPDWHHNIFLADQPDAALSVPQNKGREGMTYLTYIIDNYSSLPDIAIFLHAERYQWHNDDPLYDGARTLSRLQLTYILEQGYVNLRCVWTLGCPHEIHPLDHPADEITSETHADQVYAAAFKELFPDASIPESIGVSCCAQFAVSKATILQRPREEYERYRRWLLETDLEDGLSGRVLEYSWHIIFGKGAVFCPNTEICYCEVFGLCDLQCEDEGHCREQYTLPPFSTLPEGWPWSGWDGAWQNATVM